MKAEEFDRRFEAGEDITEYLDTSNVRRPNVEPRRVNVDFLRGWSRRWIGRQKGSV